MENNTDNKRPFVISALLSVLSVLVLLYSGLLIYVGIFFKEAQKGLEIYLSEIFTRFPFGYIFLLLSLLALFLIISVVLMWMRNKIGLYLYIIWSFFLFILLIIGRPIDWYNIFLLVCIVIILLLNASYFGVNLVLQNKNKPKNLKI